MLLAFSTILSCHPPHSHLGFVFTFLMLIIQFLDIKTQWTASEKTAMEKIMGETEET